MKDSQPNQFTKDRLIRIESKLHRFTEEQKARDADMGEFLAEWRQFKQEWREFKQEWDEEGADDETSS